MTESIQDTTVSDTLTRAPVVTESLNIKTKSIDSTARKIEEKPILKKDVLAIVNKEEITLAVFDSIFNFLSPQMKDYYKDDKPAFLEELIVRQLLLQDARRKKIQEKPEYKNAVAENPEQAEDIMTNLLIRNMVAAVSVTESELREFFEQYKDQLPEKNYEAIKEELRQMALEEKQRLAIEDYINKLKSNAKIVRNEEWIKIQESLVADNPLNKALKSGKVVVADFGRGTCIPCKMMQPILEKLQKEYEGKASILILDVGEYASLSRKYRIQLIPTQIFFNSNRKEIYRHQGFMSEADIVAQLKKMGVE